MKKRIGIIGASGYTGFELIKLLDKRNNIELIALNSESSAGKKVSELYPEYKGKLTFTNYTIDEINKLKPDLTFLCMGEGYARDAVKKLKCKVIDLSRDLRLSDEAVYGLPELFRDKIRKAQVVSNPGCYATACILAALPLAKEGMIDRVIFDCKSGYSGAGRTPSYLNDPKNYTDNVIAYKITQHQHRTEIEKYLQYAYGHSTTIDFGHVLLLQDQYVKLAIKHINFDLLKIALKKAPPEFIEKVSKNMPDEESKKLKSAIELLGPTRVSDIENAQRELVECIIKLVKEGEVKLPDINTSFTPHVIPLFRGLMSTSHIILGYIMRNEFIKGLYTEFYKNEPFVKVSEKLPELHDVQNTNYCHIGGFEIDDTEQLVVISVLDNMLKGASGQAVQNMNLMLGFDEMEGLLKTQGA